MHKKDLLKRLASGASYHLLCSCSAEGRGGPGSLMSWGAPLGQGLRGGGAVLPQPDGPEAARGPWAAGQQPWLPPGRGGVEQGPGGPSAATGVTQSSKGWAPRRAASAVVCPSPGTISRTSHCVSGPFQVSFQ